MHSHCSKKFSCDVTCLRKASRLKSLMKKNRIISMATGNETNRYQVWLPNSYSKAKFWRSGELIILFEIRSPCRNIKENNLSAADSLRISTRFCPLRFHHLNSVVFVLVVLRFFFRRLADKNAWAKYQSQHLSVSPACSERACEHGKESQPAIQTADLCLDVSFPQMEKR